MDCNWIHKKMKCFDPYFHLASHWGRDVRRSATKNDRKATVSAPSPEPWCPGFDREDRTLPLWLKIISVTLKTGRTHQIRVHLSSIGLPIVGDTVYGHGRTWWKKNLQLKNDILPLIPRQMLHAETLGFIHPDSEVFCEFNAPMPNDMDYVINILKTR